MPFTEVAFLAIFPILFVLAAIAAGSFWFTFIIPAWMTRRLSLAEHKLPISLGFILIGLVGETLLYGYGRFTGDYVLISRAYIFVGALKMSYVIGLAFAVAWLWRMKTGESHLWQVALMVAACYWASFQILDLIF